MNIDGWGRNLVLLEAPSTVLVNEIERLKPSPVEGAGSPVAARPPDEA